MTQIPLMNPGRLLSDGIPYANFVAATREISDVGQWFDFWDSKGDVIRNARGVGARIRTSSDGGQLLLAGVAQPPLRAVPVVP